LLYIGKADDQTFGKRIAQEKWCDHKNIEVYVGRLAGRTKVSAKEWSERIDKTEKLLIYSHAPAYNTSNTRTVPERKVLSNHIFNWDQYRSLFPEVSGGRYTSKFDHISDDHIYTVSD